MTRKTTDRHSPLRTTWVLAFLIGSLNSFGQGIVDLSNSGKGFNAPVSGPDGLLGVGFFAQLQSADGSNIGEPAQFLTEGLFSGGNRVVPGTTPGQTMTFQLFIYNLSHDTTGTTSSFRVTLGNTDNPGTLSQMKLYSLPQKPDVYQWTNPFFFPGILAGLDDFFCRWVGQNGIEFTAIIPVDDCFCAGLPFPAEPKRNPAPCHQEETETEAQELRITYAISQEGALELRWPTSATLFRSTQVDGQGEKRQVEASNPMDSVYLATFPMSEKQQFFWLE